jgi:hypothetical protein
MTVIGRTLLVLPDPSAAHAYRMFAPCCRSGGFSRDPPSGQRSDPQGRKRPTDGGVDEFASCPHTAGPNRKGDDPFHGEGDLWAQMLLITAFSDSSRFFSVRDMSSVALLYCVNPRCMS